MLSLHGVMINVSVGQNKLYAGAENWCRKSAYMAGVNLSLSIQA